MKRTVIATLLAGALASCGGAPEGGQPAGDTPPGVQLLNVSYDPTRELYQEFNVAFAKDWQAKTKQAVTIQQSHGGSGAQARAVIDGLEADVVTLALAYDTDAIQQSGLINAGWQSRLPQNSAPYTSTIVFLVRKGNPKGIKDWSELDQARRGSDHSESQNLGRRPLELSGGVGVREAAGRGGPGDPGNSDEKAREFMTQLFGNVPVLDSGARGATTTFVQRGIGDVLLAWENEAYLALAETKDQIEIVIPSISILAEPPVTIVDKVVDKKNTRAVAEAYLQFLYTPEGQEIVAKHHYRPRDREVAAKYASTFADVKLFTIDEAFGGWQSAQKTHFADGGTFDQIYKPGRK